VDRQVVWDAGGEYWTYTFVVSVLPDFGKVRFAYGFTGARHFTAVTYGFADDDSPQNLAPDADILKSKWITGQYSMNYYLTKTPAADQRGGPIDCAIGSHAQLAARGGFTDRKYLETLRTLAWQKNSADDIAFVKGLPKRIDAIGGAGKGGVDDFTADVKDESGAAKLRAEIAARIKALVAK
jgi:hypothetical protein